MPGKSPRASTESASAVRPGAMTWAQRLKRVFAIDIERCRGCGGSLRVIACIEDAEVIERILRCVERRAEAAEPPLPFSPRGPPLPGLR